MNLSSRGRARLIAGGIAGVFILLALYERLAPRWGVRGFRMLVGNPLIRPSAGVAPGYAVVETTGRKSGRPRQVPVGGRLRGDTFWLVALDGWQAQYVKNIEADPRVRLKVHGSWRTGIAHILADDNPRRRLLKLNPANSLFIWIAGIELLTIRIDLEPS